MEIIAWALVIAPFFIIGPWAILWNIFVTPFIFAILFRDKPQEKHS